MIKIAFYIGPGTWWNRLIRFVTRSPYSHCELVVGEAGNKSICWSASNRDGGVRAKQINLNSGRWHVINLPWASALTIDAMRQKHSGAKYDWLGVFFYSLSIHSKKRWFCSEICAEALGLSYGHRYSPARLFEIVLDINTIQNTAPNQAPNKEKK